MDWMGRARTEQGLRLVSIGTSGFVYPHWKGRFYPDGLPAKQYLSFYAQHFGVVELNNTFYRLPTEHAARGWAEAAPPGFVFALKGSRYLTHIKRLKDTGEGIRRFFDAVAPLGRATGPVLWQLPPNMKKDLPRLCEFLEALPAGFAYVVEPRGEDWYDEDFFEALNDLNVALCLHDLIDVKVPYPPPGPIYYRRFHGTTAKYAGRYGRSGLRQPASEIAALAHSGTPCFAFFNNDLNAAAISDAQDLKSLVAEALQAGPGAARVER